MRSHKRFLSQFVLGVLSFALVIGCGQGPPSRSEFIGEVVTEVPKVPGANQQYPLPQLDENSPDSETSAEANSSTK